jgi:hypothetical protein
MLERLVTRRTAQIRELLDRGALDGIRVPLRNGGTLPAALYADIALRDLTYLASLGQGDDLDPVINRRGLAEAVELLHQAVRAPTLAMS